jgi:peptide/nickel transport system permease protein
VTAGGVVSLRWTRAAVRSVPRGSLAVGLFIVLGVGFLCFAAPFLPIANPLTPDYTAALQPPSLAHPFGTDDLGRDMLSRVLNGGQVDLTLGLVTTTFSLLFGMSVGAFAGFYRGVRGAIVMRTVDAVLSLPFIVLVLAIVAIVGPGLFGVYIGIMTVAWTVYARITNSEMLVLRERQFMLAARTLAFSDARIVFRHALPNLIRPNVAYFMSDLVGNILALAGLSYLGVGVQPPTPEWGALIQGGHVFLFQAWWITTLPGLVLLVTGIGFVLLGEWFNERIGASGGQRA